MATYNKPTVGTTITTLMGETDIYVDENGKRYGTYAADAFNSHKTIDSVNDSGIRVIIPFHAVKAVTISKTTDDATKADAYCE